MRQMSLTLVSIVSFLFFSAGVLADGHSRSSWVDISDDKKPFDKHCDYKVWVIEDGEWTETWYLEAFDSENAFYTINRNSTVWNDTDAFYALNFEDKRKFLIGEKHIDVKTFALCLPVK